MVYRPKYGHNHREVRKLWAQRVAAGGVNCARCGEPIAPGTKWHLDHSDDGQSYLGPSHAGCNIAAPGLRGAALETQQRYAGRADEGLSCGGDHALYAQAGRLASQRWGPDQMVCRAGGHVAAWIAELLAEPKPGPEQTPGVPPVPPEPRFVAY